jgi:hypothetical protein
MKHILPSSSLSEAIESGAEEGLVLYGERESTSDVLYPSTLSMPIAIVAKDRFTPAAADAMANRFHNIAPGFYKRPENMQIGQKAILGLDA